MPPTWPLRKSSLNPRYALEYLNLLFCLSSTVGYGSQCSPISGDCASAVVSILFVPSNHCGGRCDRRLRRYGR
ncbi:hypothetical protein B0H14DRAFT_2720975, partial [Mycena olivaceomarginata]